MLGIMERPGVRALRRPSQGVHVVLDAGFLPGSDALLVPETPDGRVLFLIPWQGRVLVGTTDTPREDLPVEPLPLDGEIYFILETAGRYLVRKPGRADVGSVFVGLRPLIDAGAAVSTGKLSREHHIEVSPGGLVTITGGKWTTYRRMAEDCVNAAADAAGLPRSPCVTATLRLHGADAMADGKPQASGATPVTVSLVRRVAEEELARTVEDVLARI